MAVLTISIRTFMCFKSFSRVVFDVALLLKVSSLTRDAHVVDAVLLLKVSSLARGARVVVAFIALCM